MDPIEKAIRGALEKGDAQDEAFRERVYRSAFAALERALNANANVTVETAIKRRKSLEAKIAEIESEFHPAAPAIETDSPAIEPEAPAVELDSPAADAPAVSQPDERREPELAVAEPEPPADAPSAHEPELVAEPSLAGSVGEAPAVSLDRPLAGSSGAESVTPSIDATQDAPVRGSAANADLYDLVPPRRERPRGRPLAAMFIGVTLLCILAIGVWWAIQTGLIKLPGQVEEDAPPQVVGESEDFIPEAEEAPGKPGAADPQRDWIAVFEPADAAAVTAPSDAKAEVMQDDSGDFLRVRSGASGSAVIFDVGQGILERVAGKKATFDIVARSEPETETEMMVDCNFGELGDCGRKRYSVGRDKGDYLFELDMPKASPGSGGTIAINSDFGNGGKAVDIYAIRVSVSE